MRQVDIIQAFANNQLKDGDVFSYFIESDTMRLREVRLKVHSEGKCLTESWYDKNGRIICNNWSIYKNNLVQGVFAKSKSN